MRLLSANIDGGLSLTTYVGSTIPSYAILSHTWEEDEEVAFHDMKSGMGTNKAGYNKLRFCENQAKKDGLKYFWVDTCCIDKSSSAELSEAVNSMFRWYRNAAKCYVYLSDVSTGRNSQPSEMQWESAFRQSRWFTRGWTLPELLAPRSVDFFCRDGIRLGDRNSLEQRIHEITAVAPQALQGISLSQFSVYERMSWAASRKTTIEEDEVYCLLGIFDVYLPLIYGEGKRNASGRLQYEIERRSTANTRNHSTAKRASWKEPPSVIPPDKAATASPTTEMIDVDELGKHLSGEVGRKKLDASKLESQFMLPFSRDHHFIGREDILDQIIQSTTTHSVSGHTRVALTGLGGIGKSQIAIEYAYRAKQILPRLTVLWIHASTPARFEQGYRDFARKADIPGQDNPALHILELVRDWLSDLKNGKWLMVLDNVDNGDDWFLPRSTLDNYGQKQRPLGDFLPQSPNGTVIVTSRNSMVANHLLGNYGESIFVNRMSESDALALLGTKVSFDHALEKDTRALVYALEGIPLAITQAAAYIKARERLNIRKYYELFQESEINMAALLNNDDTKQDPRRDYSTRHPILRTWQITIKSIQETSPQSADLLALMSIFDRQQIPKCLIDASLSSLQFEENIAPLLNYSLIHQQTGKENFGMHRLVQLATRKWLETSSGFSRWKSQALKIMADIIPVDPVFKNWPLCQDLLPHAKELVANIPTDICPEDALNIATILEASGWYLMERIGEYKGAEKNMRDAFTVGEQVLGLEHPVTIKCLGALSSAHRVQGELMLAEATARRALQLSERAIGPDSLDTAKAQFRLGILLVQKKNHGEAVYGEAELILRRALSTWEEKLGWGNSKTLFAAANLALTLAYQRKYEEAEPLVRRAIESMELVLGEEHADTMIHRNILPEILEAQQKYPEAEEIYKRNLEVRQRVVGPNHPRTLGTIRRLVNVLEKQGKHDEAQPWKPNAIEAVQKGYYDSV